MYVFNFKTLKILLYFSVILIPFIASTEYAWATSVIILLGSIAVLTLTLSFIKSKSIEFVNTLINPFALLFFVISVLTIIPYPAFVLKAISPNTYNLYKESLLLYPSPLNIFPFRTLSLYFNNTALGLAVIFTFFAIFFCLVNRFDSFRLRARLARLIVFVATFIACWGIVNMYFQNKKLFWIREIISGLPTGPFINTIHFASFMALCIPLALGIWVGTIDFRIGENKFNRAKLLGYKILKFIKNSFLYFFPVFIMVIALFKALSRGAMIASFLSIVLFSCLVFLKKQVRPRVFILLFISLLFTFTLLRLDSVKLKPQIQAFTDIKIKESFPEQSIGERILTLKKPLETDSAKIRLSVWKDTFRIFLDFPLFGTGLNTFSSFFLKYKTIFGSGKMFFTHAENDYIETFSETGLLGSVFLILAFLVFLRNALFNLKFEEDPLKIGIISGGIASFAALLMCSFTDFAFHIPAISYIFMLICFIIWPKAETKKILILSFARDRKGFISVIIGLFLIFIFMFFFSLKTLLGQINYYNFIHSPDVFELKQKHIQDSIIFDSANADYRYKLGKLYFDRAKILKEKNEATALEFIKKAKINFDKAIDIEPANWRYHYYSGSAQEILAASGIGGFSFKGSRKYFDNAIKLNPTEYEIYYYLANFYLTSEPDLALSYYKRLISLRPYLLRSVLDTIWKVNSDPYFIRQILPNDPAMLMEYANFLKQKGYKADEFYKEAAGCLLDKVEANDFFKKNKDGFVIPLLSAQELLQESEALKAVSLENIPPNSGEAYKLALFYYQLKDYNIAIKYFLTLVKSRPFEPGLRYKLALALYNEGRYTEAYTELSAVMDMIKRKYR